MRPKSVKSRKAIKKQWLTRSAATKKPNVVIVGFGRLGGALALGLKHAGWPVKVFPRSGESARRAVELQFQIADLGDLQNCQLCVLAVPDAAIGQVAEAIKGDLGEKSVLLHCAGALPLSVLKPEGNRPAGSFHPLCAIASSSDRLEGHSVAIAASDAAIMPLLKRLAMALHLRPIAVPEGNRALYHSGAVLSAGLSVALLSTAMDVFKQAGIDAESAQAALLPLLRSALRAVEERGIVRGMTGPIVRGDVEVVHSHLRALSKPHKALYQALSLQALDRVQSQLPADTVRQLRILLTPE